MEGTKEVTITIRVEESLRDSFKAIAAESERSFSAEVRRALRLYAINYELTREAA